MRHRLWPCARTVVLLLLPLAASGQTPTCGNVPQNQELVNPPEIHAVGGALSTTFDVQQKTFCVPATDNKNGTWATQALQLRTYVYPDPKTGQPTWGLPGPTLRLRKADQPGGKGESLAILLKNSLPYPASDGCDSACDATAPACNCDPTALDALIKQCAGASTAACCCIVNCTQVAPNCQHGDNVTNLHFHGSHSSPQEPQDFVLLDLWPAPPSGTAVPQHEHGTHGPYSKVVYGQYQYKLDPFDWMQPEGSHWYHPHKHGSVGLQIANGMAGALLIEGPFDDWLKQFYDPATGEKVMVIQSVTSEEPLFKRSVPGAQILVNNQIQPKITVKPGEIQRWRFINATMSSRTLIQITLPAGLVYRQVAMDGVRFSPINYECQPLMSFTVNTPAFPCNPNPTGNPTLQLAPGNRADFLVQMPLQETGPTGLRVERKLIQIPGEERGQRKLLLQRDEEMAPGPPEPQLFSVVVDDGIPGNEKKPKKLKAGAKRLPATLPPMPDYLRNITADEVKGNSVAMTFQQFIAGRAQPWPYSASSLAQFKIDGTQFKADCANVTTRVDTAAEWTVGNDTVVPHPFHIHTNPFQLIAYNGVPVQPAGKTKPEPFWLDTLTLPKATVNPAKAPADPSTPIQITRASMTFRQRYEEFTGEYVLHCHFLGHEDRGMMFSVQTVCKDKPDYYGLADGKAPECSGELIPKLPACQ